MRNPDMSRGDLMGLVVVVLTVLTPGVSGRNVTLQRAMLRYVNVTLTDVVNLNVQCVLFHCITSPAMMSHSVV